MIERSNRHAKGGQLYGSFQVQRPPAPKPSRAMTMPTATAARRNVLMLRPAFAAAF
jgi:hypothetical protein